MKILVKYYYISLQKSWAFLGYTNKLKLIQYELQIMICMRVWGEPIIQLIQDKDLRGIQIDRIVTSQMPNRYNHLSSQLNIIRPIILWRMKQLWLKYPYWIISWAKVRLSLYLLNNLNFTFLWFKLSYSPKKLWHG